MKEFIVTQATFASGCSNRVSEPSNPLPSKTVPGMAMSMRELVQRYTRGDSVPTFTPQFHGDDSLIPENLERLDAQDRLSLSQNLRNAIQIERSRRSPSPRSADPVPVVPALPEPDAAIM